MKTKRFRTLAKSLRIAHLTEPIFDADILITFGSNEQMKSWYEKKGISASDVNPSWQAFCERITENGQHTYHLHFTFYGFRPIVHETHHAAFLILSDRGLMLTDDTKEAFAYYQDWLAGAIRDIFEQWTTRKRK